MITSFEAPEGKRGNVGAAMLRPTGHRIKALGVTIHSIFLAKSRSPEKVPDGLE